MIYEEKNPSSLWSVLILAGIFLLAYQPWFAGLRELFYDEGFFAALASHMKTSPPDTILFGERIMGEYPLYPLLVRTLCNAGCSMEMALRGISFTSITLLGAIVFYCCYRSAGIQAALAGAAAFFSCILCADKCFEGSPVPLAALGIFSAWMLWFDSGSRRGSWNSAWIYSGLIAGLTFYCIGWQGLILIFVPMFFLRRPLGFQTKKKGTAFVIGICCIVLFFLLWELPRRHSSEVIPYQLTNMELPAFGKYALKLLLFPLDVMFRFLPWTLFLWAPFCPQLSPLDASPLMSRYLRVLLLVSFVLLWFAPISHGRDILYLLAPMSALVGLRYWIVVRRYGWKLLFLARFSAICSILFSAGAIVFLLLPARLAARFLPIPGPSFSRIQFIVALVTASLGAVIAFFTIFMAKKGRPVWLVTILVFLSVMLTVKGVVLPYRAMDHSKSRFGLALKEALGKQTKEKKPLIYKLQDFPALCSVIHYAGFQVQNIVSTRDLPEDVSTVFMLSGNAPASPERIWKPLFFQKYMNNIPVGLWQGDLREEL